MSQPFQPPRPPVPPPGSEGGVHYSSDLPAGPPPPPIAGSPFPDPRTFTTPVEVGVPPDAFATTELALEVGRPPVAWLGAALATAAAAIVLVLVTGGSVGWAVLGWTLAGPVAIGLLAAFTIHNTRRQALPLYDNRASLVPQLYWSAIVIAGAGITLSAWHIADCVGRL